MNVAWSVVWGTTSLNRLRRSLPNLKAGRMSLVIEAIKAYHEVTLSSMHLLTLR